MPRVARRFAKPHPRPKRRVATYVVTDLGWEVYAVQGAELVLVHHGWLVSWGHKGRRTFESHDEAIRFIREQMGLGD